MNRRGNKTHSLIEFWNKISGMEVGQNGKMGISDKHFPKPPCLEYVPSGKLSKNELKREEGLLETQE